MRKTAKRNKKRSVTVWAYRLFMEVTSKQDIEDMCVPPKAFSSMDHALEAAEDAWNEYWKDITEDTEPPPRVIWLKTEQDRWICARDELVLVVWEIKVVS